MAPLARVDAREHSGDVASSSLNKIIELIQVGITEESERALTILCRALSAKLCELEIPCSQIEEALLWGLYHSLQVVFLFFCYFIYCLFFGDV